MIKKRKNPEHVNYFLDYINTRRKESNKKEIKQFWKLLEEDAVSSNLTETSSVKDITNFLRIRMALLQGTLRSIEKYGELL